jgi:hypothetical protein
MPIEYHVPESFATQGIRLEPVNRCASPLRAIPRAFRSIQAAR